MRQRLFITSTGTGIGKTFTTAALVRQAKAPGKSVMAYKPVISGFDPARPEDSDSGLLLRSLDLPLTPENIARVSPWRFAAPLAPSMAARMEKRAFDFNDLAAHGRKVIAGAEDIVLIEGIGGVMVPLDERHTVLDWIAALGMKAVLVTGSYLGTISHTLTALEVLRQRKIPVAALIVNESEDSPVALQATADELSRWTQAMVVPVKRHIAAAGWRDVKELLPLVA